MTEHQAAIGQRLLDTYPYGLEYVDVWDFFRGRDRRETSHITSATTSLSLTGFCRGNCRECARSSKPYTRQRRKAFAVEPLMEFLTRHKLGTMGELMIYDAGDPLDYPDLIRLLMFFDASPNYRKIELLTSCPPGSEELFRELMGMQFRNLDFQLQLSHLPSRHEDLEARGVYQMIEDHHDAVIQRGGYPNLNLLRRDSTVTPVGRAHVSGHYHFSYSVNDETVLDPVNGPCSSEVHLVSDLFPEGRSLQSVDETRRVYLSRGRFAVIGGQNLFGGGTARLWRPESSCVDLDTGEWIHSEVGLRHLVIYLYTIIQNVGEMLRYHPALEENLALIYRALEEGRFVMPTDPKELAFYRKLVLDLVERLKGAASRFAQMRLEMAGRFIMGGMDSTVFRDQQDVPYARLVGLIEQVLRQHQETLGVEFPPLEESV